MIKKLFEIVGSRDTLASLLEKLRANPKTAWVAIVVAFLGGGAMTLYDSGYLLAAGLVGGVASLVAVVALVTGAKNEAK